MATGDLVILSSRPSTKILEVSSTCIGPQELCWLVKLGVVCKLGLLVCIVSSLDYQEWSVCVLLNRDLTKSVYFLCHFIVIFYNHVKYLKGIWATSSCKTKVLLLICLNFVELVKVFCITVIKNSACYKDFIKK